MNTALEFWLLFIDGKVTTQERISTLCRVDG